MRLLDGTERIVFLRSLGIDPGLRARVASGRWDQMVREGNSTPAWLANDFNASRRQALIVAQVIKLDEKLTDDGVTMFIKLIGRLLSQSHSRKKRRRMDHRTDTSKALRLSSIRYWRCDWPTTGVRMHLRWSTRRSVGTDCFG